METEKGVSKMPQIMRNIFAILMVIVFVAVGVLCLVGYFPTLTGKFEWLRWVGGVVFIIYGFWRGYRQFRGVDPDVTTRY